MTRQNDSGLTEALKRIADMPVPVGRVIMTRDNYAEILRLAGLPEAEVQRRLAVLDDAE